MLSEYRVFLNYLLCPVRTLAKTIWSSVHLEITWPSSLKVQYHFPLFSLTAFNSNNNNNNNNNYCYYYYYYYYYYCYYYYYYCYYYYFILRNKLLFIFLLILTIRRLKQIKQFSDLQAAFSCYDQYLLRWFYDFLNRERFYLLLSLFC